MVRVFIPWADIIGGANVPLIDRAQAARQLACAVRRQRPWLFHAVGFNAIAQPFTVPAPLSRFYWDRLCPDNPLPAASVAEDSPPFIGGQCLTQYRLDYLAREKNGAVAGSGNQLLTGPIQVAHGAIERTSTTQESGIIYYQAPTHNGGNLVRNSVGTRNIGILLRVEFSLTRTDGNPDSCGNNPGNIIIPPLPQPPNITIPINYDGQTRPVTINFPNYDVEGWPDFSFEPVFDVEGTRFEFLPDGLNIDLNPDINIPSIGSGGGNQTTNIENTVGDIISVVTDIQQIVEEQATPNMTVSLPFSECGDEPETEVLSGELPTVLGLSLSRIAANLNTVGERACDNVASVPEWWQVRPGQRSQLVIQYAGLLPNGKESRSRWSLIVPHYRYGESFNLVLPPYEKGRFYASLRLKDNSQIWVNAKTTSAAIAYVQRLRSLVEPSMLDSDLQIHSGERRGQSLTEVRVKPVRAMYFPDGQRDMNPEWTKNLRR